MVVAVTAACGGDGRTRDDGGVDAARPDASLVDASADAPIDAGVRACADVAREGPPFALDPSGPPTEIHASLAFDGEHMRLAFARPDPEHTFDIWMTTIACDGTPGTPERVSTTDANEVDPEIVVTPTGASLVVWTADDGQGGTDNMHVYYRVVPDMPADAEIRTTQAGVAVPDNHMADTVVVDGDGYLVAGIRALASTNRFHGYVQRLAADGSLDGDAWESSLEPDYGYGAHSVAPAASGGYVAFERSEEIVTRVWLARVGSTDAAERAFASPAVSSAPHLAADLADPSRVYLVVAGEIAVGAADVWLTVASDPSPDRPRQQFGASGRFDGAPRIVPHPDGGGVVLYAQLAGSVYHLLAQRFRFDGTAFTIGPVVEVAPAIAPYPTAAVHVTGDLLFAAWSEGAASELQLAGRFVAVP